jgi:hypothetical protein
MQLRIHIKTIAQVQARELRYKLTFCIKAVHHSFLQIQLHRGKKHSVTQITSYACRSLLKRNIISIIKACDQS